VDEGIRYDQRPKAVMAAVDASSHAYLLYGYAARWSRRLGQPATTWTENANAL
jgi:hypothetical protein